MDIDEKVDDNNNKAPEDLDGPDDVVNMDLWIAHQIAKALIYMT